MVSTEREMLYFYFEKVVPEKTKKIAKWQMCLVVA